MPALQFSISITVTAMRLKMVQTFKFISNSSSFHSQQSLSLKNTTAKTIQKKQHHNNTKIALFIFVLLYSICSQSLLVPAMDELDFGDDETQLHQRKRKAPIPISKTARKTAQKPARSPSSGKKETKKKKNEQAQKKRREKKTSTKKDEKIQREKKTNEKKTLEMAEGLFSELLDLSTRVDIRPLEHKPGKPIRPLDELSCFSIDFYVFFCIRIFLYHFLVFIGIRSWQRLQWVEQRLLGFKDVWHPRRRCVYLRNR